MLWEIKLTKEAAKSLERIPQHKAKKLRTILDELANQEDPGSHRLVKWLSHREGRPFEIKIDDYRAIFTFDEYEMKVIFRGEILVQNVIHRKDL